jgi:hypothetical protein
VETFGAWLKEGVRIAFSSRLEYPASAESLAGFGKGVWSGTKLFFAFLLFSEV